MLKTMVLLHVNLQVQAFPIHQPFSKHSMTGDRTTEPIKYKSSYRIFNHKKATFKLIRYYSINYEYCYSCLTQFGLVILNHTIFNLLSSNNIYFCAAYGEGY